MKQSKTIFTLTILFVFIFSRNLCEAKALDLEKKNDFLGQIEKQEIFEQLRADLRKASSLEIMDMLEDILEESGDDWPSYGEILETIGYYLETDF